MLKLKNVSKFYYNKGVIASGFSKVNLELDMGEFVVITGESGSGKSTLLNVLSGLDTYEEGEMYIKGEETSHYSETDFENYRKQYVGNIFQSFNLVNSYTVYQNVELVLLLNGYKKKEVKNNILKILNKVGLLKFKNTKVSKLSGGQKQRVAIARALAKETPIIVADEPTGNLDSKSAKEIVELLSEISKDKLVILVTHNLEQVEQYATRLIKMHDGRIVEDKRLVKPSNIEQRNKKNYKKMSLFNKVRLGVRNTFNIIPKFLLTFAVFFFVTLAVMAEYTSFKKAEYESSKYGDNMFFNISSSSDKRIVVKKNDGTAFTEEDYLKIKNISNVDYIIEDDILLDIQINIVSDYYAYFYGCVNNINTLKQNIDFGRMPTTDNEIVIALCDEDYKMYKEIPEEILDKEFKLVDEFSGEPKGDLKLKVVGITKSTNELNNNNWYSDFYVSEKILENLRFDLNETYSNVEVLFNDKIYTSSFDSRYFNVMPSTLVSKGNALVSNDLNDLCSNGYCKNKELSISVKNMYYNENLNVKINSTYTKYTFERLTGLKGYENYNGTIFINNEDYDTLFNKGKYQSSVFVSDVNLLDETDEELQKYGLTTLKIRDAIEDDFYEGMTQTIQIFKVIVTAGLLIALFFISYFVIKIILKSRNTYFATIRMLGATKKISKQLLDIELFIISNLAFFIVVGILSCVGKGILNIQYLKSLTEYLTIGNYIIIYLILSVMSQLVSHRFSKNLFKESAVKTHKGEV